MTRYELYKAVKHEVTEYQADHGYALPEMWRLVNEPTEDGRFWMNECMNDYEEE